MSICNYNSVLLIYFLSLNNAQIIPSYDKLCAFESAHFLVDGTYENPVWNPDLNGSTYYNEKTSQYLYPYIASGGYRYFMIGPDPIFTSIASLNAYCTIQTTDHIFNIADCFKGWKYLLNGKETNDINMRIINCNDIRVTNSDSSLLNGIYLWFKFINTYSVYYCQECDFAGAYIFGWIYPDNGHEWRLGPDYHNSSAWNACPLSNSGADYLFNLQDCEQWRVYNSTKNEWYIDGDMEVKNRVPCDSNEYCVFVDIYPSAVLPTSNVVSIKNNNDDAVTYFHIFFTPYGMSCIRPTIEFKFEAIDYDSPTEYIRIINDNGTSITSCSAEELACGGFTQCFAGISIGVDKIEMNKTHQISIIESPHVDALCTLHDYSINAQLTLTCAVPIATDNPSHDPTNNPTQMATLNRTRNPSNNPTTFPTVSPTRVSITNTTVGHKIQQKTSSTTILIVIVVVLAIIVVLCVVIVVKWREKLLCKKGKQTAEESDAKNAPAAFTEIQRMITPGSSDYNYVREGEGNKTIGETDYV